MAVKKDNPDATATKAKTSTRKKPAIAKTKSTTTKSAKLKTESAESKSNPVVKESDTSSTNQASTIKKAASKTKSKKPVIPKLITDSERFSLIEKTAYYIAEARGFSEGDPQQDWLIAEAKVNQMLQEPSI